MLAPRTLRRACTIAAVLNVGAAAGLVTAYLVDEPSPPAGADAEPPVDQAPRLAPTSATTTPVVAVEPAVRTRSPEPPPTTAATTTTAPPDTTTTVPLETTTTTAPPDTTDTTAPPETTTTAPPDTTDTTAPPDTAPPDTTPPRP